MFDAYNIRKIAPRMLLAVIGVNLSIYLCVAAVDITNVIGGGLGALIREPFQASGSFGGQQISFGETGSDIAGGVIGAVGLGLLVKFHAALFAVVANTFGIVLLVVLLLMLGAALIALAIMATVVIRFGAIILLTLASPIAISMLVLPGTEKYFRKWWEYFLKTLVVYPIIAAIFAISDAMGAIFLKVQTDTNALNDVVIIMVLIVVVYAPLFMIPFSFKLAGGFLGSVYDLANKNMYGRAKPKMDKFRENENSMYGRARTRAINHSKKMGVHPEAALKRAAALKTGFGKEARRQRRQALAEQAEREKARAKLAEYERKRAAGTATHADFEEASRLAEQGHVAEDGSIAKSIPVQSLLRSALQASKSEGRRYYASTVRNTAIKSEETDEEVKDIIGNDDVGKAIKAYVQHGIESASKALRESNPFEYNYAEAGISEQASADRKRAHDQVLTHMQAMEGRYGTDVLDSIGARQDARASTGSDAYTMREDAIRMSGGVKKKDGSWDTSNLDTVALARNLDDLRGFAKEASRLDKAGIGFSGDLKVVQGMLEGKGTEAEKIKAKEELLMGALEKNSASSIATMHDKGIGEINEILKSRIKKARDSAAARGGDIRQDADYQRAIAEAANLYDAFQYASPKNMSKLSGLIGDTTITSDPQAAVMEEIEEMRGKMAEYEHFAKYRRDWGSGEAKDRIRSEEPPKPGM